jgi:cytochrome c biogenesis protein CcmG, thiol:disulfide interchange protein DsbE
MTAQRVAAPVVRPQDRAVRGGRGRLSSLVIMAATAVLILGLAYLANRPADAGGGVTPVNLAGTPTGPAPIVGQPAPDFSATTVDGTTVKLADLKGSVVWVTFGASWCQPCRAENPDVEATYEAFKARGVVVVQVYMGQDANAVADYSGRVGLTYTRIPDPASQLTTEYRILGIPTHFFIDRQGVIRQMKVGTLDRGSMASILTELAG